MKLSPSKRARARADHTREILRALVFARCDAFGSSRVCVAEFVWSSFAMRKRYFAVLISKKPQKILREKRPHVTHNTRVTKHTHLKRTKTRAPKRVVVRPQKKEEAIDDDDDENDAHCDSFGLFNEECRELE